jgi:antitoxin (DNA-binding transcriptional repressor) of toxin-antitoxin stability system
VYSFKEDLMTVVSIKEARSKIGHLIEKAENGEEIIITRHGKKVASINAIPKSRPRLTLQGDFRKSIKLSGPSMSSTIEKNRSEERF